MKNIVFENVKKAYGKNVVVEDLCMEVKEGERLILLGPSGCGKSTTLRMIAGLENVTAGNLWMRDQVVNDVPCGERGVSMVFQNYALFPHMSVKNNIIYGLKAHKMDENEIDARLKEVLKMLELEGLEDSAPRILLATGRLIGEGFDHPPLDTLVLAMPISWKGTLQQYAGRLHREHVGKGDVRIYDYAETDHPQLARMWDKRQSGYRSMGYEIVERGTTGQQ